METALGATQWLLAIALLQQSAEYLATETKGRGLFIARILLCLALLGGGPPVVILGGLTMIGLALLHLFQGPYNGGSDKMSMLVLCCCLGAQLSPQGPYQELFLGYLAVQMSLSYFVSGKVKLTNADWRSGKALADVFAFSAYPVSKNLRRLSERPLLLKTASWGVIAFEISFPLAMLHPYALVAGLSVAACFHLANACLFGLNRFLWIWLASYPSALWFQDRIFGG